MAAKKEFKNQFSWSFSRHSAFNACKRKYYYSYYGSWGGWNKDADDLSRKLYMLNKMTSLPMLAGSIVHDEVEKILKTLRYGRNADQEKSKENVIKIFKQAWSQSKNKEWEDNPKWKTNLFEHYYDQKPSDQQLLDIRDLMINSIDGFFASDSYRFIQTMSDSQWLAIEDLDFLRCIEQNYGLSLTLLYVTVIECISMTGKLEKLSKKMRYSLLSMLSMPNKSGTSILS